MAMNNDMLDSSSDDSESFAGTRFPYPEVVEYLKFCYEKSGNSRRTVETKLNGTQRMC